MVGQEVAIQRCQLAQDNADGLTPSRAEKVAKRRAKKKRVQKLPRPLGGNGGGRSPCAVRELQFAGMDFLRPKSLQHIPSGKLRTRAGAALSRAQDAMSRVLVLRVLLAAQHLPEERKMPVPVLGIMFLMPSVVKHPQMRNQFRTGCFRFLMAMNPG